MSYTALYRKYRPKSFDEVVGQEPVVQTLTNQIKMGRVGHAYLFCGTRGTGKTTIAKIFARAVNCENPVNGSPCNSCSSCRAILEGSSMNVAEIDAASNNGVENIRQIRDEVRYSPTDGKYRVYIIDEVHMLSPGAYNALLKTLEEPPSYVIFILATTEVHRIPVTVLSRCQRYDFKRISSERIFGQLQKITQLEGISAEEKALRFISRSADGAMRDALSILEECVSYYYGQTLTYDNCLEVVGAADTSVFSSLLLDIVNSDVTSAIRVVGDLIGSGRDITQAVSDFVWFLRNILLIQTSEVTEDELGMSTDSFNRHKDMSMKVSADELLVFIKVFSELQNSMKLASDKRTLFEATIIRAIMPDSEADLSGLKRRVSYLEDVIAGLEAGEISVKSKDIEKPPKADEPVMEVVVEQAVFDDLDLLRRKWNDIAVMCGRGEAAYLRETEPTFRKEYGFVLPFENKCGYNFVMRSENMQRLVDAVRAVMEKDITFRIVMKDELSDNVKLVKAQSGPVNKPGISIGIEEEDK